MTASWSAVSATNPRQAKRTARARFNQLLEELLAVPGSPARWP